MQNHALFSRSFAEQQQMPVAQGKQREQQHVDEQQFDDAAFERAFEAVDAAEKDAAQADAMEAEQTYDTTTEEEFERQFREELVALGSRLDAEQAQKAEAGDLRFKDRVLADPLADQHDILDAIEAEALAKQRFEREVEQQDMRPPDADMDADELSRTAGQLLDSVSHETNEKFQQSSFLALMRRLRDREVRVEGDKMVEVRDSPFASSSVSAHPTVPSTPVSVTSAAQSVPMSFASSQTSIEQVTLSEASPLPRTSAPSWIDWVDNEGVRHMHAGLADSARCKMHGCSVTDGHLHGYDSNTDSA